MEDIGSAAAQTGCVQEPAADALALPSPEGGHQPSSCSSISDGLLFDLSPEWRRAVQSLAQIPSLGVFTRRLKRTYEVV